MNEPIDNILILHLSVMQLEVKKLRKLLKKKDKNNREKNSEVDSNLRPDLIEELPRGHTHAEVDEFMSSTQSRKRGSNKNQLLIKREDDDDEGSDRDFMKKYRDINSHLRYENFQRSLREVRLENELKTLHQESILRNDFLMFRMFR